MKCTQYFSFIKQRPDRTIIKKEYIFLKTIIPSRKATKMYKDEQEDQK